jgi:hypothetical protein
LELRDRILYEARLQDDPHYLQYLREVSIDLSTFWLRLLDQTVEGFLELAADVPDSEYSEDFATLHTNHLRNSNLILAELVDTGGLDVAVLRESVMFQNSMLDDVHFQRLTYLPFAGCQTKRINHNHNINAASMLWLWFT